MKSEKVKKQASEEACFFGENDGTRTHDLQGHNLTLPPAELHPPYYSRKILFGYGAP